MKKPYEEKPGKSFDRFEKAVRQILAVPKKEIDAREAEYRRTKKTAKKRARLLQIDGLPVWR